MHITQRRILYRLAFEDSLKFGELKPGSLDNKAFDYHLKKTISEGLVSKDAEGRYLLTPVGRKTGSHALEKTTDAETAYSVLFLAVRQDESWLLYRRNTHPLKDRVGFMHARPVSGERIAETAARECLEKTGLSLEFSVEGSGFFRTLIDDELESFTNFTLLNAEYSGDSLELSDNDSKAEYFWQKSPDFNSSEMLPNMATLVERCSEEKSFFVDMEFRLPR